MAPPQLARDAPGLDVLEPVEPGLGPGLGHDLDVALASPPRRAGSASLAASTYHWSVSHGSITTPERSPIGRRDDAVLDRDQRAFGFEHCDDRLARLLARRGRAGPRGISPSCVWTTCACASNMLSMSPGLNPARLPTSKSLKSWPGVILTAPEPSSGSACSSATIGIRRPVIGCLICLPTSAV